LPAVPDIENRPVTVSVAVIAIVETPTVALGVNVNVAHVWAVSTVATALARPELASNMTSSVEMGTDAPDTPPDVRDHLVVLDQLPAPPTQ
jgi:energy-converting hydrogenase Eha subunit A